MSDSLAARIACYSNTAAGNDAVYSEFTRLTDEHAFLKKHRDFVEANAWGFGDRAFHYMWLLILTDLASRMSPVRGLEIGVYKGQSVSLWALIAREMKIEMEITGVSPFEGNARPGSPLARRVRRLVDRAYRRDARDGNLYEEDDYLARVREIFSRFDLAVERCRLIRGRSTDPDVIASLGKERFSVIYVDGDHSFEGVRSDIMTYGPLVEEGGYLVMDDASFLLPGTVFWKGRESVSRACDEIPSLGFTNVLNVGHDRIYRKETLRAGSR